MEQKQIEQAANEANTFLMASPWHCYIAGAKFVNDKQPYTAEDMKNYAMFASLKPRWISIDNELLKLWEEQRNG
jgi:hypothetical protein